MKKELANLFRIATITIFWFIIGSFYNASFSIPEWSMASRGLITILYIGTIVIEYCFRQVRKTDNYYE